MGGKGSGHWRHAGRKGKRGGSAPSRGKGGPSLQQKVSDEEFAKSIGIPTGYSWEEGEWAAEYILTHKPGDPIGVRQADLLANVVFKPGQTQGEWAEDILSHTRPHRLVRESKGILDTRDEIIMRQSLPKDVWTNRRIIEVLPESAMPDISRVGLEHEWGISRYAVFPDVKPLGNWEFEGGEFIIQINAEADKYGLTKRHVFYHEFSHTIPDFAVYPIAGKPKPGDIAGDLADRFANAMEQSVIEG